jgi:hypothetical protein
MSFPHGPIEECVDIFGHISGHYAASDNCDGQVRNLLAKKKKGSGAEKRSPRLGHQAGAFSSVNLETTLLRVMLLHAKSTKPKQGKENCTLTITSSFFASHLSTDMHSKLTYQIAWQFQSLSFPIQKAKKSLCCGLDVLRISIQSRTFA